jgi:predicted short-subunit dehydrogenase-like oxidoreductase (DUF2520 family)
VVSLKIGFIGAGKAGKALGLYFKNHGLDISGYFSRSGASAENAAVLTGSAAFRSINTLLESSGVIFLTVPDHALEEMDVLISELLKNRPEFKNICFLHVSGALPSGCMKSLGLSGAELGSMHPLLSFGEPDKSAGKLEGALFTIEGTGKALEVMGDILETTGGKYGIIPPENKPLYHAGAAVVSNYLVTLLESGLRCFEAAGIERAQATQAVMPLVYSTLENIRGKGTVNALTGPIARGDFNTVAAHAEALKNELPGELEFYKTMARKTIEMISGIRIDDKQEKMLRQILEEK